MYVYLTDTLILAISFELCCIVLCVFVLYNIYTYFS